MRARGGEIENFSARARRAFGEDAAAAAGGKKLIRSIEAKMNFLLNFAMGERAARASLPGELRILILKHYGKHACESWRFG